MKTTKHGLAINRIAGVFRVFLLTTHTMRDRMKIRKRESVERK